ncbi:MAG: hypothetical protein H6581_28365 [Bacteroidia bacterium]|nr:hypothetical protein [Bacteroidia bacterium]
MKNHAKVLRISILAGSVYFIAIAAVHFLQIKIPGFYIYFDVPSSAYQDKIISLLAFGWGMAFFMSSQMISQGVIRPFGFMLLAGLFSIIALSVINLSTEIIQYNPYASVSIFWLETGGLLFYLLWLGWFYGQAIKD